MHLFASPVVVVNTERYRPSWIEVCSLVQLENIRQNVLAVPELQKNAPRLNQMFELLKCLPQTAGGIGIVEFVEAPYKKNFEATTPFLADSKNWKVDVHAALNDFLPEFGSIKKFKVAAELEIFMVSTTLRLLDRHSKILLGDAQIVEHTWENRMVNGTGFALLDLDSGTYLGDLDGHQSLGGMSYSKPKAGHTLFSATIFSEEIFAEHWAQECSEFYPNIAIAPIQTRVENVRVVQMDPQRHARTEEHLARFSKSLIQQAMEPQLLSPSKTTRKI